MSDLNVCSAFELAPVKITLKPKSDNKFIELREKRYLPVMYAHLSSLAQIERLLGFKEPSLVTTEAVTDRFTDEKSEGKKDKSIN